MQEHSDWPCIRFTAALQQRQQDWIVLVAAVILCFIVQVGQQFNTLRRATRHWANIPSDRLSTAVMADILQLADKRALTTGKAAWPAPKGPSTQQSSDRYLRLKESLFWSNDICIKALSSVGPRLYCRLGEVEVQRCEINTRHQHKKEEDLISPQLAAHFAEEEANCQQAEGGWSAENTSPVVIQVLPQTTCKSLGEKHNILYIYIFFISLCVPMWHWTLYFCPLWHTEHFGCTYCAFINWCVIVVFDICSDFPLQCFRC